MNKTGNRKVLFFSDGILQDRSGLQSGSLRNLRMVCENTGPENTGLIVIQSEITEFPEEVTCLTESILNPGSSKLSRFLNYLCLRFNISRDNIKKVISVLEKGNYNILFLDNSMYGVLARQIRKKLPGIKIIVFFHDFKRAMTGNLIRNRGLGYLSQAMSMAYNERIIVKYADALCCLTRRDQSGILLYYGRESFLIPVSMSDRLKPVIREPRVNKITEPEYLFVGVDYHPNVKGVRWFVDNVLGNIPGRMYVVGKGMERYSQEIRHERLTIVGTVSNEKLDYYYQRADCVVAPVFEGGGMKIKVVEALMFGKYIFGTSESFAGYELPFEKIGGICDDADTFRRKIIKWLEYYDFSGICKTSRLLYEESYSDKAVSGKFGELLNSVNK